MRFLFALLVCSTACSDFALQSDAGQAFDAGGVDAGMTSGTVLGNRLVVVDAVYLSLRDLSGRVVGGQLVLADQPGLCAAFENRVEPKNLTALGLSLLNVTIRGSSVVANDLPDAGVYPVAAPSAQLKNGLNAFGSFTKTDANCTSVYAGNATETIGGAVIVSALNPVAGGGLVGTFDITFGIQADRLQGRIDAKFCDVAVSANAACQ